MKSPTTIPEAIWQLKDLSEHYFDRLGLTAKGVRFKSEGDWSEDDKENSDLHLEINEWICVTPFHTKETYPCIGRTGTRDAIHYSFQIISFIHGIRYRKDGSGEPDDVDIVEVKLDKPITSAYQAIEKFCHMLLQNELDAIGEDLLENELANEEEQMEKP